jgi:hypothetical protein
MEPGQENVRTGRDRHWQTPNAGDGRQHYISIVACKRGKPPDWKTKKFGFIRPERGATQSLDGMAGSHNGGSALAMTDLRSHPALSTSQLAATLTRLLNPHEVLLSWIERFARVEFCVLPRYKRVLY